MHTLAVVGQILIGLFFVLMGLHNLKTRNHLLDAIRKKFPCPEQAVWAVLGLQVIGGALLILNWMTAIAATYLFLFSIGISYLLHPFWTVKDPEARRKHILVLLNHVAVLGGLLLILGM